MNKLNLIKKIEISRLIDIAILIFLALFPLFFSSFRTEYMGKVIVYAIFALSVDLLWGYTGLMSMGHSLLFGLGGYAIGLCSAMSHGLPDFMNRFGLTEIPLLLRSFQYPIVASLLAIIVPGIIAFILGYFIFKSKINGVFFSLISLVLCQIVYTLFGNKQAYTNGSNGIGGIERQFFGIKLSLTQLYYLILIVAVLVFLFCLWLTKSRFGKILEAIRENEHRLKVLGYNPANYKIAIHVIAGMIAGLGGMLYAPISQFVSPADLSVSMACMPLIWICIGGKGNLTGAVVGTLLVNWMQMILSEYIEDVWIIILGAIMIFVVFCVPDGLIGTITKKQRIVRYGLGVEKEDKNE